MKGRGIFALGAAVIAAMLPALAVGSEESLPLPVGPDALPPAYTDCAGSKTSQPFLAWGDVDEYVEVANGSFDLGFAGWTLQGGTAAARVVPTFRGMVLEAGKNTKITSPRICFDETRPHARMLTRLIGDEDKGAVQVQLRYRKLHGVGLERIDLGGFNHDDSSRIWTASPRMGTPLGVIRKIVEPDENGNRWFQYRFRVKGKATWQFDDLFVDPRRRH